MTIMIVKYLVYGVVCSLTTYLSDPNSTPTYSLLNIKSEIRSFKSNENIHKKEGGSYYVVSDNKASSVTL